MTSRRLSCELSSPQTNLAMARSADAHRRPGFLRDHLEVAGFLTEFRRSIADFGGAISDLDGEISKFYSVLKAFLGVTAALSIFIFDMAEDISEFVPVIGELHDLLVEFNALVAKLGRVFSTLDGEVPELGRVRSEFLGVLTEYNSVITEFNVVHEEFEVSGGIPEVDDVNNYVPRVSPASEEKIARLEKVRIGGGEETCSICLEKLLSGSEATRLRCRHDFHGDCIEEWLKMSGICPFCRSESP